MHTAEFFTNTFLSCVGHSFFFTSQWICVEVIFFPNNYCVFSSPVTPVAFPLAAAEVLSSPTAPEMAVPSVNKAIPVENPLEPLVPGQEIDPVKEASIQAPDDQQNGVAATQEMTKQTEEIALVSTPVSQQGATADPAGDSAVLPVPEEPVPSVETQVASSEEPRANEEAAPPVVVQSQELIVAAEESTSQEIPVDVDKPEAVPGKKCDPKHCAAEDIAVASEDGKANDSPKAALEEPSNLEQDQAQDGLLPGDVNVNVATQKESPAKEEPVTLLSKANQSKGTSKCDGPPLSTRPLSGWFIL